MRARDFMFESKSVPRPLFKQAMQAALSELMTIERITSPKIINDGLCDDFVRLTLQHCGLGPYERLPELRGINTGYFYGDDDRTLDLDKLRAEGEPVPDLPIPDHILAYELGRKHFWLIYHGRHYDAEALDGVEHWLLLPYFQRVVEWLKTKVK